MKMVKLHKNTEKVTDRDVCHFYFYPLVVIILTNETRQSAGRFRTHVYEKRRGKTWQTESY